MELENDPRFELIIALDEETRRVKQTAIDCIETIQKQVRNVFALIDLCGRRNCVINIQEYSPTQIKKPPKNLTQDVLSQYIAFEWLFSHTALWLFAEPLEAKSILEVSIGTPVISLFFFSNVRHIV